MSGNSNAKGSRSIRVNLRFGPGTDPALWKELEALAPYARAKLVRRLMLAGWRPQRAAPGISSVSAPVIRGTTANGAITTDDAQDSLFRDDILALVGGAVKL